MADDVESGVGGSYGTEEPSSSSKMGELQKVLDACNACRKHMRNPLAMFFHFFFKIVGFIIYVFLYYFLESFVITFIILILIFAMDFWVTKNVSGRLLAGLRWWNVVQADGSNLWRYEAAPKDHKNHSWVDVILFWVGLLGVVPIWLGFAALAIFEFHFTWLIVIVVALILTAANVYGYARCMLHRKDAYTSDVMKGVSENITPTASKYVASAAVSAMQSKAAQDGLSGMASTMFGRSSTNST